MSNPAVDDDPVLLCPGCGFDLRATASDRCGECGLVIDRGALQVSGISWAYRRRIGRVRAYFKTFWQVTLDRKTFRYEAAKPQDAVDGRAFRRVTAGIVALALLAVFAAAAFANGGLVFLAIQPEDAFSSFGRTNRGMDRYLYDFTVPWSAGATVVPVLPACLILLAFYVTGVQRFVFRTPSSSAVYQQRAVALSYYTSAPLVLLLPAMGCCIVAALLAGRKIFKETGPFPRLTLALAPLGGILYLLGVLATVYRTGQWLRRIRHSGAITAAVGVVELMGLWLLGWVFFLGVLPWCVGFLWIVVDSLR